MKKNRIIYCVCIIFAFIFNRFFSGFISAMLMNVLLVIPIIDTLCIGYTFLFLKTASNIEKETAIKGERILYEITVTNSTPLLFCPIEIQYSNEMTDASHQQFLEVKQLLLFPLSKEIIKQPMYCDYRGTYNIGVKSIRIMGFFNLFSINSKKKKYTHEVLIYPHIYELENTAFAEVLCEQAGSIIKNNRADERIFSDIKSYMPGDALNKIHWKLSARHQKFMSKEFTGNVSSQVKMLIDGNMPKKLRKMRIVVEDYMIEGAVALSKHFLESSTAFEMIWFGKDEKRLTGCNRKEFPRFYEHLARVQYRESNTSFAETIEFITNNNKQPFLMIILTPVVDETLKELLIAKKQQGYEIHIVILEHYGDGNKSYSDYFHQKLLTELKQKGIIINYFVFEDTICRLDVN